jgi:hypothetical protein
MLRTVQQSLEVAEGKLRAIWAREGLSAEEVEGRVQWFAREYIEPRLNTFVDVELSRVKALACQNITKYDSITEMSKRLQVQLSTGLPDRGLPLSDHQLLSSSVPSNAIPTDAEEAVPATTSSSPTNNIASLNKVASQLQEELNRLEGIARHRLDLLKLVARQGLPAMTAVESSPTLSSQDRKVDEAVNDLEVMGFNQDLSLQRLEKATAARMDILKKEHAKIRENIEKSLLTIDQLWAELGARDEEKLAFHDELDKVQTAVEQGLLSEAESVAELKAILESLPEPVQELLRLKSPAPVEQMVTGVISKLQTDLRCKLDTKLRETFAVLQQKYSIYAGLTENVPPITNWDVYLSAPPLPNTTAEHIARRKLVVGKMEAELEAFEKRIAFADTLTKLIDTYDSLMKERASASSANAKELLCGRRPGAFKEIERIARIQERVKHELPQVQHAIAKLCCDWEQEENMWGSAGLSVTFKGRGLPDLAVSYSEVSITPTASNHVTPVRQGRVRSRTPTPTPTAAMAHKTGGESTRKEPLSSRGVNAIGAGSSKRPREEGEGTPTPVTRLGRRP